MLAAGSFTSVFTKELADMRRAENIYNTPYRFNLVFICSKPINSCPERELCIHKSWSTIHRTLPWTIIIEKLSHGISFGSLYIFQV